MVPWFLERKLVLRKLINKYKNKYINISQKFIGYIIFYLDTEVENNIEL